NERTMGVEVINAACAENIPCVMYSMNTGYGMEPRDMERFNRARREAGIRTAGFYHYDRFNEEAFLKVVKEEAERVVTSAQVERKSAVSPEEVQKTRQSGSRHTPG
ncbi:MAG: hypothetical protein KGJ06_07530, partial [Pseudomonadota bacterium]|nr:hypothetical protein [Pseudomonadota bacterium]